MKTVLVIALVVAAWFISLTFASSIMMMPFEQITQVLNAVNASTNS